jgi:hypothetical protein
MSFVEVKLEVLTYEIDKAEVRASGVTNREEAPLSVRTIGAAEVKRNPGGNRDISRALRSLPGVASTPSFRNDIIIIGGAPNENRFYIDGIEIPNINHFSTQGSSGGPVGLINVDFIESVQFYSGAFPASRGNALSSIMEFTFKEGRKDRYSANAVLGSSDLGITVEGPIGEKSSLIVSARRSYLQYLFQALRLPFLPTYNDFQFKLKSQLNEKNQLTVLGLGAIDQFQLNTDLADPDDEDYEVNRYILGFLAITEQWNYAIGAKWDHFHKNGLTSVVLSRNMLDNIAYKHQDNNTEAPRIFDYESFESENKFRVDHRSYFEGGWKLTGGVGYEFVKYFNSTSRQQFSYASDSLVADVYSTEITFQKYASFVQLSKTFGAEKLVMSLGVRADGNNYSPLMSDPTDQLSPRFSARLKLLKGLNLNASVGRYYQLPPHTTLGFQNGQGFVNKETLSYIRCDHISAGLSYDLGSQNAIISVEGFKKDYRNYPRSQNTGISLANMGADFGVIGAESVLSDSKGRAYGMEVLLQQKLYKGFYGILAYTYVRSEFTNDGEEFLPSSWDSQHLISATGGKRFKKGWELGMRFLYSGGLPSTPVDEETSVLIPVWNVNNSGIPDYGRLNSERLGASHQLDVRLDKKWFFDRWSLDIFLDIQNIYGAVTPQQPYMDVERDEFGAAIESSENPGSYTPRYLDGSSGTVLPSIGLIIEL